MTARQGEAMRRRWASCSPEERRLATSPALQAATERRALAARLLGALEASGIRVESADDDDEEQP